MSVDRREIVTVLTVDARDLEAKTASTAAAIELMSAKIEKMTAGVTGYVSQIDNSARANARNAASMEKMLASIDPVYAAHQKITGELGRVENALKQLDAQYRNGTRSAEGVTTATAVLTEKTRELVKIKNDLTRGFITGNEALGKTATVFTGTSAAVDNATKTFGNFRGVAQQAGYQIGDFAVQVQGGTSAITAFTQQGSQLLGVFGPWGAVAGAVLAVTGGLAGAMLNSSSAAQAATTAYTDYSAAMELAKTSSGELTTASGPHLRALEAERRGVLSARDAIIDKALAEVMAAEASAKATALAANNGAPELGMAAGEYDRSATVLTDKFKGLRQELNILKGEFGVYNDGAREVWSNSAKNSQVADDYRSRLVDLNKSIGDTITQLHLEVDGHNLSNAAKLRAKLTSDALTAAGLAEAKSLPEGTRALIDRAVGYQASIDAMKESEALSKKNASAAASDAKAYDGVTDSLDRQIDAQQRLLDIAGLDEKARRAANEQTLLATELAKAHVEWGAKEADVIALKVHQLSQLQAQTANRNEITSLQQRLELLNRQNSALHGSYGDHEQILWQIQLEADATKKFGDITSDAAQQWIGLKGNIHDAETEQKRFTPAIEHFPKESEEEFTSLVKEAMA